MKARDLPALLAPSLRVVFVGTEPGSDSIRLGCYYANPDNSFWEDLHAAGLTPTVLAACEYRRLLALGIGLDDVYDDAYQLRDRLIAASPSAICFNSKEALARVADDHVTRPWAGAAAGDWVSIGSAAAWAVPDSSPRASKWRSYRRLLLRDLAARLPMPERTGPEVPSDRP